MKFHLITPRVARTYVVGHNVASPGSWSAGSSGLLIIWNAELHHLTLAGHGTYELSLNREKNPFDDVFDGPDGSKIHMRVSHAWDHVGPAFMTKMRSAGIIVACKIMRKLAPIEEHDTEAVAAAVQSIADEYGGVNRLDAVNSGSESDSDYGMCMLDQYFRRKREQSQ